MKQEDQRESSSKQTNGKAPGIKHKDAKAVLCVEAVLKHGEPYHGSQPPAEPIQAFRHRGKRCMKPEAVFGQMKHDMACRRFRHTGEYKATMGFAMAFNIKKMCAKLKKAGKGLFILAESIYIGLYNPIGREYGNLLPNG